jgi:hypothetical protein
MDKDLELNFSERRSQGDWQGAFQAAFEALARSPEDEDLFQLISSTLAENEKVIPSAILEDARLDAFFCHCDLCGEPWIPKGAGDTIPEGAALGAMKPEGIQCPSCGGTFCNRCYLKSGETISCPRCLSTHVAAVAEPNGRNIIAAHHHVKRPEKKWWQIWH